MMCNTSAKFNIVSLIQVSVYCLSLWLNVISLIANAEETANMTTPSTTAQLPTVTATSLTLDLLIDRQKAIEEEQMTLMRNRGALLTREQNLPDRIAKLSETYTSETLEKATLSKEVAEIELENLRIERQSVEKSIEEQQNELKKQKDTLETLQKTATSDEQLPEKNQLITQLQTNITLQQSALKLEEQRLENLKIRVNLANKRLELSTAWYVAVQKYDQTQQQQDKTESVQKKQQEYLATASELRKKLDKLQSGTGTYMQRYALETQLRQLDELTQQGSRQLKIAALTDRLTQLQSLQATSIRKPTLVTQEALKENQTIIQHTDELKQLLDSKLAVLQQQQQIVEKRDKVLDGEEQKHNQHVQKVLAELNTAFQKEISELVALLDLSKDTLVALEIAYKEGLRRSLLRQRELPNTTKGWQELFTKISAIPNMLTQYLQVSWNDFIQTVQQTSEKRWIVVIIVLLVWLSLCIWIRTRLKRLFTKLNETDKRAFAANSLLLGLRLLHRNALGFVVIGMLLLLTWLIQPPYLTTVLILTLSLVWLGCKLLINTAWLLVSDEKLAIQNPVKLYRQIRGVILFMGLLTIVTRLAHLLLPQPNFLTVRDLIDSVFMLFLSLTALPVVQIRNTLLALLKDALTGYWLLVIRLTSLLISLSIIAVALLGLVGYINLGWYVAKHLSLFLVVLTSWLVIRGLLTDLMTLWKNYAIKRSYYGLLWTQDIIPLVHKLLGIMLVILAIMAFLRITGWSTDTAIMESIKQFFAYSLIDSDSGNVSVADGIVAMLTLWMVFWFGGWVRQITYRWIYLAISDLGARHSLSVFTQYIVVLIGLLITLRVIGVNLTTLTVFAGALGVGIGFGLQNIANNFVSGILLLIERPLRTGDMVSIGTTHEATVTNIGIRSMTLRTQDYQEVIVPNSELISNSFTNWTHSDSVGRTTFILGVSYEDDPHLVAQLLKDVLRSCPDILLDPPPNVYLWELAASSVNFRVAYYVNLRQSSRSYVKSVVLFKIWDSFKTAGVQIPYPQQDVHIKSLPTIVDNDNVSTV